MKIEILTIPIWLFSFAIVAFSGCTFASNQQSAAEHMRLIAVDRAKSNLQQETLPQEEFPPNQVDYEAISAQIHRLSKLVEGLAAEQLSTHNSILFHGIASGIAQRQKMFGMQGPTVTSVSALMRYRLVLVNNRNLKLGSVTDKGSSIHALLITQDGSVVEEYSVDKQSGQIITVP